MDLRIASCFTQQQYTQVLPIVTLMTEGELLRATDI